MNRSLVGAAGAALVAGLATLAINAPQPAGAQEEFRVTAGQLKINQRISQAAVRRANEALTRLDALAPRPALEVAFFAPVERDGTMAGPIATPHDPVDDVPGASAPAPIQPAPREANPAPVGIAGVDLVAPGRFNVRLTRLAWTCAVQATLTDPIDGRVAVDPPQGATVHVVTRNAQGAEAPRAFHLTVLCPTS